MTAGRAHRGAASHASGEPSRSGKRAPGIRRRRITSNRAPAIAAKLPPTAPARPSKPTTYQTSTTPSLPGVLFAGAALARHCACPQILVRGEDRGVVMGEKIDQFCETLRMQLNEAESNLSKLKGNLDNFV